MSAHSIARLTIGRPPDPQRPLYWDNKKRFDLQQYLKDHLRWERETMQELDRFTSAQAAQDPNVLVSREHYMQGLAAAAGSFRFRQFQAIKLTNLKAVVQTAGTSTAGAHYTVQIGTGTAFAGTLSYGTGAAETAGTLALNTTLLSNDLVKVVKGAAADGQVDLILEYNIKPD